MKTVQVTCDRCGKDAVNPHYHYCQNHLKLMLIYWHGGSVGGKEDEENFEFDLCEKCAEEFSNMIKGFLKNNNRK